MPKGKFVKWIPGSKGSRLLIDAVHAAPPKADAFTGTIARAAAQRLGAHFIVATVSRNKADLNRPRDTSNAAAIDEYRSIIHQLLSDAGLLSPEGRLRRPILHLAVHGMTDEHGYDVEIGTRRGATCSADVRELILKTLQTWAGARMTLPHPKVVIDKHLVGNSSKVVHRCGDSCTAYEGYGTNFNTIQLEFAHWLRRDQRSAVVEGLVALGRAFIDRKF